MPRPLSLSAFLPWFKKRKQQHIHRDEKVVAQPSIHNDPAPKPTSIDKPAIIVATESGQGYQVDVAKSQKSHEPEGKSTSTSATIKNTLLLATNIVGKAPVPWVGFAASTILESARRYGEMQGNKQELDDLGETMSAFLYLVETSARNGLDQTIIDQFERRLEVIKSELPSDTNAAKRFVNVDAISGAIAKLKEQLNIAIQILQTSISLQAVKELREYKTWKAERANELEDGDVVETMIGVTINAGGRVKMNTEADGKATRTLKDSTISSGESLSRTVKASALKDEIETTTFDAGGDVDLSKRVTRRREEV